MVPYVEAGYVTVGSQYRGGGGSEGTDAFGGADVEDVLNLVALLKRLPRWTRHGSGWSATREGA